MNTEKEKDDTTQICPTESKKQDLTEDLFEAANRDDLAAMKDLLKRGADPAEVPKCWKISFILIFTLTMFMPKDGKIVLMPVLEIKYTYSYHLPILVQR